VSDRAERRRANPRVRAHAPGQTAARARGTLAVVTKEILALGITLLVHVVGLVALVWMLLLDPEDRPDWRDWWPRDDDDRPVEPSPVPSGGGVPLPDARPSAVRLWEPARIGGGYPRPERRPAHPPERVPERTPAAR
jgi:hypothetical protein